MIFNVSHKLPIATLYNPVLVIRNFINGTESRTLYSGTVGIEKKSKQMIITDLENHGCADISSQKKEAKSSVSVSCYFVSSFSEDEIKHGIGTKGILVYPFGPGWGPVSFEISDTNIYFGEDIAGLPDIEKVKRSVREKVKKVLSDVQIDENTWAVESVLYPVNFVY